MHPLGQHNNIPIFKDVPMPPMTNEVVTYPPKDHQQRIYIPSRVDSSLHALQLSDAANRQKQMHEQRRAASALAQMLKAYGGISRLSSLGSRDRQEIAAKVNAIQRHVLQKSGGGFSSAAPVPQQQVTEVVIPNESVRPMYRTVSSVSGSSPVLKEEQRSNASAELLKNTQLLRRLLQDSAVTPFQLQPQKFPNAYLQKTFQESPERQNTYEELEDTALPILEPISPPSAGWNASSFRQQENANMFKIEGEEEEEESRADHHNSLRAEIMCWISKASARRKLAASYSNSVEVRVWKSRRLWNGQRESGHQKEEVKLEPPTGVFEDLPVWSGSQFLRVPNCNQPMQLEKASRREVIPIAAWWDEIFSKNSSDDTIDAADSVTPDALISQDVKANHSQPDEERGEDSTFFITTVDGSLDAAIDSCYFRIGNRLLSQPYPPAIAHGIQIQRPSFSLLQHTEDELAYATSPYVNDRFLQEMLRGKHHLFSDLNRPIPECILEKAKSRGGNIVCEEVGSKAGPYNTIRKPAAVNRWRVTPDESADNPYVVRRPPRREGLRTRGTYRTPDHYYEATLSPASPVPLESVTSSGAMSPQRSSSMAALFLDAAAKSTRTDKGGPITSPAVESEFEVIKRASGWHPYVWYLMCRRPELYNIGIRARVVARVAGWEWDEIQKMPELLHVFMERIYAFIEKNPVPRSADKKESKEYKHFAANSVRTPWFQMETAAVRRALRDMENVGSTPAPAVGGVDSDSGRSDTGSSEQILLGRESSGRSAMMTPVISEFVETGNGTSNEAGDLPLTIEQAKMSLDGALESLQAACTYPSPLSLDVPGEAIPIKEEEEEEEAYNIDHIYAEADTPPPPPPVVTQPSIIFSLEQENRGLYGSERNE